MVWTAAPSALAPRPGKSAMTAQAVDGTWRREILPLCVRCDALIHQGSENGRVLKATGERWFGGHTVGRFEAKGIGEWSRADRSAGESP